MIVMTLMCMWGIGLKAGDPGWAEDDVLEISWVRHGQFAPLASLTSSLINGLMRNREDLEVDLKPCFGARSLCWEQRLQQKKRRSRNNMGNKVEIFCEFFRFGWAKI